MNIGLITASFGRNYIVELNGQIYNAVTKAKKSDYVVGDKVKVNISNDSQVQIIELVPRKNVVFRSNNYKSKLIASNISQLLIVIAVTPNFNVNFLNACLVFAHWANIKPIIIINKADLKQSNEFINSIISLYVKTLNYISYTLEAINSCEKILPLLENQTSLLIGQSGVGKSTITNALIAKANSRVGVISKSNASGCHTTTNATLYHLNANSDLIDCPGLQDFGLYHLDANLVINYFPELHGLNGKCRFRDCKHHKEPDCIITNAYNIGKIEHMRYKFLLSLLSLLDKPKGNYN